MEIGASIAGAAPILLGVVGSVLLGVLALIVVPLIYSVSSPILEGVAIFAAHTLIVSLPLFLIRQRVLPDVFLSWSAPLPVSRWCRFTGDAWATAIMLAPLGGAYLVSSLVWVWQWPLWLRSVWLPAFAAVLLSLVFSWLFGMVVLHWHWRADRARRTGVAAQGCGAPGFAPGAPVGLYAHEFTLAHKLLCLPLWRQKSALWHVAQSTLMVLMAASVMGILLLKSPAPSWRVALGPFLALLVVGLTLWRDAAMQRNLSHLMREGSAWPLSWVWLQRVAILWAVLPAIGLSFGLLVAPILGPPASATGPFGWFPIVVALGALMVLWFTKIGTRERWAFAIVWAATLVICGGNL